MAGKWEAQFSDKNHDWATKWNEGFGSPSPRVMAIVRCVGLSWRRGGLRFEDYKEERTGEKRLGCSHLLFFISNFPFSWHQRACSHLSGVKVRADACFVGRMGFPVLCSACLPLLCRLHWMSGYGNGQKLHGKFAVFPYIFKHLLKDGKWMTDCKKPRRMDLTEFYIKTVYIVDCPSLDNNECVRRADLQVAFNHDSGFYVSGNKVEGILELPQTVVLLLLWMTDTSIRIWYYLLTLNFCSFL